MHHDFARRLYFLQAIKGHVVEVAGAVEVPLLVPHNLLEEDITTGFSLFFLQEKIVS